MVIPSSLLFQVSFIRWIETPEITPFFYSILISVGVVVLLHILSSQRDTHFTRIIPSFSLINVMEKNFEGKCAQMLRGYLEAVYVPHHTRAHTSKDIYTYVQNKEIIKILHTLESAQYSGRTLSLEKRKEIGEILNNFVTK